MRNKVIILTVAVLVTMRVSPHAIAGLVVDWDKANYTPGADASLQGGAGNNPSGFIQNFNPVGAVMSSVISSDYANQALYGVFQTFGDVALAPFDAPNYVIEGTAGNTNLHGILSYGVKGAAPNTSSKITGLFSIQAADFLNCGVAPGDTLSSVSLDIQDIRGDESATARLAVKNGGAWYLSDISASGNQVPTNLVYSGGNWAAFTPADASSTLPTTGQGLTYDVNGTTLSNIEEVGFFFEGGASGTSRARLRVQSFEVTTLPVPEPTILGLITLVGGFALVRRRFRV